MKNVLRKLTALLLAALLMISAAAETVDTAWQEVISDTSGKESVSVVTF